MKLFIQSYLANDNARQQEIDFCRDMNRDILDVVTIYKQDRSTFSEMLDMARKLAGDGEVVVIANSDIIFDETIKLAEGIKPSEAYCLARWDGPVIMKDFNDRIAGICTSDAWLNQNPESADAWVLREPIRDIPDCDFGLGIWGCDGAFAERLSRAGYEVSNPSQSIKCYHVHQSNFRTSQFPQAPKPWATVHNTALCQNSQLES
jgi:hypothetical protein